MKHTMKLQKKPFDAILKGKKNIELRLNDEKRQQIQVGDKIIFKLDDLDEKEFKATVVALHHGDSFVSLFKRISLYDCGFVGETSVNEAAKSMREYYSEEQEKKYGVVGIELSEIYWATRCLTDNAPVLKYIPGEKWRRMYNFAFETSDFFTITTAKFVIKITGGSVKFFDKETEHLIHSVKGFNYLYTGDVNPDETELMALENGKHFYIFSLSNFAKKKRVTLPRNFESIDMCGKYSKDGKILYIPVYRFVEREGYIYRVCLYETDTYSLIRMDSVSQEEAFAKWGWR